MGQMSRNISRIPARQTRHLLDVETFENRRELSRRQRQPVGIGAQDSKSPTFEPLIYQNEPSMVPNEKFQGIPPPIDEDKEGPRQRTFTQLDFGDSG